MSADAHAAHGAGGHSEGITENQKSVGLAIFVIVALLASIYYLVGLGEKRHGGAHGQVAPAAAPVAAAHEGAASPKIDIRRPREGRAFPPGPLGARMRFAAGMERRQRRRGTELSVEAAGKDGTTFQITFPGQPENEKHAQDLKRAEALFRQARGLGFTKFTIRIGNREIFGKDL